MIDEEVRRRILKLWRQGHNKSEIKRRTGVSLPTIRKIVREADEARARSLT